MSRKIFQTVITAALLHDIGKFLQRGDFGSLAVTGKHPEVSRTFIRAHQNVFARHCDVDLLAELVARHHESSYFPPELQVSGAEEAIRPYAYMISRADNYSSEERDEAALVAAGTTKKTALVPVFSRLQLEHKTDQNYGYKLQRLSPSSAFPVLGRNIMDETPYKKLLREFGEEFNRICQESEGHDFDKFFTSLFSLLENYTWCVPASTQDALPDVSLFDHLKTTAAIAAALFCYHEEQPHGLKSNSDVKFRLVVGDLSGIQKYIFQASVKGYGKIAKRLRARSFFLSIMSDIVSHMLLHAFSLPVCNLIMSSGGKFYVLLPNTTNSEAKIEEIRRQVDRELLERYHGELALNLASISFSGDEFADFAAVMARLTQRLASQKSASFASVLRQGNGWHTEAFIRKCDDSLAPCPACGKIHADGGECDDCLRDIRIGANLPKTCYISFFKDKYPQHADEILSGYAITLDPGVIKHSPTPYLTYNVNEKGRPSPYPELKKYMAKYVPTDSDQVLNFDEIAAKAKGNPLLGCLKADVDYLGMLFLLGFHQDERNYATISRITALSRMLDLFFAGRVEQLLAEKYTNCYAVYSGGDDVLVIGPWNDTYELAADLNDEFHKFTANNPDITLSAGLSLFKPRFPIDGAVDIAERLLTEAKNKVNFATGVGRNQISVFGQTLNWAQFTAVRPEAYKLAQWLAKKQITAGAVYRLQYYGELYRKAIAAPKFSQAWEFVSLMQYDISRNQSSYPSDVAAWLKEQADKPHLLMAFMKLITTYALFCIRGGKELGK